MDGRIDKVIRYINDNIEMSFNLKELASQVCLSPSQFHRIFKKSTHKTPFQYIEDLKMDLAYQSILHGKELVNKIAFDLGYRDYETFSRAFKRRYIFSPDDLKSILDKMANITEGTRKEDVLIASMDVEDEAELIKKIKELLVQKQVSPEDLTESKIFKISKVSDVHKKDHLLIKNKFALKEEINIKKSILE